jgi:hypothetical protein
MAMNTEEQMRGWLSGRLPDEWFTGPPEVSIDRDEVVVVGELSAPPTSADAEEQERLAAEAGRITEFRERTREQRMRIARELERSGGRKVAWGARCGDTSELFTTISVPVMTRLRQPERLTLDTLVDSGVARSRSDALAWCVRLVAGHADEWLAELRSAMEKVEEVRSRGPA